MVDNVEITIRAGSGGNGAVTFRMEKFAPRGGPDGGDGGRGGSVVLEADCNVDDLSLFKAKRFFKADNGGQGGGNKKSGKNAADLVIRVPAGTLVRDIGQDPVVLLADLARHGDRVVAGVGGRGGWGNMHFATPSRQAPVEAKPGTPGEEKRLQLELRLVADIVLVGPPNTGKSTLLAAVSRASPVIADYPFTTREPVMGTVDLGNRMAVVIELPGIIPQAHEGRGLGNRFLRHAERSGALLYVLGADSPDPAADYAAVRDEVYLYDEALKGKPQVVAVNKADLPEFKGRRAAIKRQFAKMGVTVQFVSAQTGKGAGELIRMAVEAAEKVGETVGTAEECPVVVFRPKPKARRVVAGK